MMKTVSVRLDDVAKARWDRLARDFGLNQSQLMRDAINDKLEELEDFYVVKARMNEAFTPVSNEDVWKQLAVEN